MNPLVVQVISISVNVMLSGIVGLMTWFMKQSLGRVTDRITRLEKQADNFQDELGKRVLREDYIRETARFRVTLERQTETLARIEGRMDIGTRVAQAIDRLADQKVDK